MHVGSLRATSKGSLKLKSANPFDHPIIDPNYLATGYFNFFYEHLVLKDQLY